MSTIKYLQLKACLQQSTNFGNGMNPDKDYCDPEGITTIYNFFDNYGYHFIDACSFDTAGTDDEGNTGLFRICYQVTGYMHKAYGGYDTKKIADAIYDELAEVGIKNFVQQYNEDTDYGITVIGYNKYEGEAKVENLSEGGESSYQEPPSENATKVTGKAGQVPNPQDGAPVNPTLADGPSAEQQRTVNVKTTDTNEFYKNCLLFLEGVCVPYNTITVSYGVTTPATCTLLLPAHQILRNLPETTKIHIFFQDLLMDDSGEYQWRLLFDGEMSGYSYTTDSSGAYINISGVHSCAYTTLMQLMTLDAAQYMFRTSTYIAGEATIPIMFSQNRMHSSMIDSLLKGKFASMADVVYQMMRGILNGNGATGTGKYYASKLGNVAGGWKILNRIYGVSKVTADSAPPTTDWSSKIANEGANGAKVNKQGSDQGYKSGSGTLVWPCTGEITSVFGEWRQATGTYHNGIDIAVPEGTPIHACDDGTVTAVGAAEGYGQWVQLSHGNGRVTEYGHISSYTVSEGDTVNKGDVIAYSGNTGYSSGPHLHLTVREGGEGADPMKYLS